MTAQRPCSSAWESPTPQLRLFYAAMRRCATPRNWPKPPTFWMPYRKGLPANWVSVAHEPGDKRHATVTLTEQGQRTLGETLPHAQQITELTFGDLSAEERQQLIRLLRRISGAAAA